VFENEFFDEVGAFEHDATAGVMGAEFAEVLEERGVAHGGEEAARVANVLGGELDDGAGLDAAGGSDMMADAGAHGAERLALVIVVGVDDGDRHFRERMATTNFRTRTSWSGRRARSEFILGPTGR
jgi:hypothetical protein